MKQVEQSIENKKAKKDRAIFAKLNGLGTLDLPNKKSMFINATKIQIIRLQKDNVMQFTNEKQFLNFRDMMEKVMRVWNDVALY